MCGIAGVFSLDRPVSSEDEALVSRMTAVLAHRGPDSRGAFRGERCALGNTRLKVIDLSPNGSLPMANEDGSVVLCYNGEVTNFRELKEKHRLADRHPFRSTSDAEVLLRLYEDLGISFLDELSGYFAIALYDRRKARGFLIRDFYGIRPLFTMRAGGRLYFASEIKALMEAPEFRPEVDAEAISHFFSLAYIPGVHTPFSGVRELQGGRLIELDLEAGTAEERSYYEIRYKTDHSIGEREAARRVRELLRDSVRRNLISDAPLGLTLSGGVDTSSILALTRDLVGPREIHTFSVRMTEPSFDESAYQKIAVDRFGPVHHEIVAGPRSVMDTLVEHMAFMEEPMGDGSAQPLYLLAKEAKKTVSVLLSGEGGDEVFNAYETHRAYRARKFYRGAVPAFLRAAIRAAARFLPAGRTKLPLDFLARRFTEGAELDVPRSHFHWRHVLSEAEKSALLLSGGFRPTDSFFSELFDRLDDPDELNKISMIDMKYFLIGDVMMKNDRVLMANSIEARFPYMDRPLMEFVSSLPGEFRVKGMFTGRYIQREAMRDLLPRQIYKRQNMGLELPHAVWFFSEFRELAGRYFAKKVVDRSGLLNHAAVKELWDAHLAGRRDNGRALWCILSFLVWFDLFVYERDYKKYLREGA